MYSLKLPRTRTSRRSPGGFTLLETLLTITAIALLTGIVTFAAITLQKNTRDTARDTKVRIIANALEKYYRDNGEYPSVAAMTTTNVDSLKTKLKLTDTDLFKLPGTTTTTSLTTSSPSHTRLVYSANTTDSTKNNQCQTNTNGYCDGYTLQYTPELSGTPKTVVSLNTTFEAVRDSDTCAEGDTQNGMTCTHTYPAAFQEPVYSCPSGGTVSGSSCIETTTASYSPAVSPYYYCPSGYTLSGTTCSTSYSASYASGGGYYYCPSGATLSGSNCITTSSYAATSTTSRECPSGYSIASFEECVKFVSYAASYQPARYECPSGFSLSGTTCTKAASPFTVSSCPHPKDTLTGNSCYHDRQAYTTKAACQNAGYSWNGSCYNYHAPTSTTTYTCSSGVLSGSTCTTSAIHWFAYYYCSSGDHTLSGATCAYAEYRYKVNVTTYSCPSGGSLSGTNCVTSSTSNATYYSYPGYYYCSGSATLSGTTCNDSSSASYNSGSSAYYYCPSGYALSSTTCTRTTTASSTPAYHYCPSGGTIVGSTTTCSYTYELEG